MKTNNILGGVNVLQYLMTTAQTNQVFQIIELVLAIATSIVLLAYRIWHWWKESSQDGHIDAEEMKDGIDILIDGIEDIKDKTKKEDKEKDE